MKLRNIKASFILEEKCSTNILVSDDLKHVDKLKTGRTEPQQFPTRHVLSYW